MDDTTARGVIAQNPPPTRHDHATWHHEQIPPALLPLIREGFPRELAQYRQFVTWALEWRPGKNGNPGKWTKEPRNPRTGANARTNDHRTWGTWADVLGLDLIGFVFCAADPYTMLDVDNAIDERGQIKPWALEILRLFPGAYWEVSVSGTGLKGIIRGHVEKNRIIKIGDGQVEIFSCGKYSVLTGHRLPDSATTIGDGQAALDAFIAEHAPAPAPRLTSGDLSLSVDDRTIIERIRRMEKGRRLYDDGDIGLYGNDHSAADQALVNHIVLAGATDEAQIDRIFRTSALMREKWDKRKGYRDLAINKALRDVQPFDGWDRPTNVVPLAPAGPDPLSNRSHTVPPAATDPCTAERDTIAELRQEVAKLRRENAELQQQLAERDATIAAFTQLVLNPHLTHKEKIGAVNIARHVDAKRRRGQVDATGNVALSSAEASDDWREKPAAKEHIAPTNPDGTIPHMPRSSGRDVLNAGLERGILKGERKRTIRRRANGSTYPDWEYLISPETSFVDLLTPWATWRPEQPKTRKVRESRACPSCGEVHPIQRIDYCTGCGAQVREQTIDPEQPDASADPPMGESFSPIETTTGEGAAVVSLRVGTKNFSHTDTSAAPEEPAYLATAPDPVEPDLLSDDDGGVAPLPRYRRVSRAPVPSLAGPDPWDAPPAGFAMPAPQVMGVAGDDRWTR